MTRHINGTHAAHWLSLAATPVFAVMTLLTIMNGDNHSHHAVGQAWWPLSEMGFMYFLMSVFHAAPWLKLIVIRGSMHDERVRHV